MKTKYFLLTTILILSNVRITSAQQQCVKDAWNAFNNKNYKSAIASADICIDEFGKKALRIQDSLTYTPPVGKVSKEEKEKIFDNGLLNDVATACYIKGRSAEYLFKKDKIANKEYQQVAADAYKKACDYKLGRSWDPQGWFWSPCETASDRLPIE
jgi:hypothetical protein